MRRCLMLLVAAALWSGAGPAPAQNQPFQNNPCVSAKDFKKDQRVAWEVYVRAHQDLAIVQSDATKADSDMFDTARFVYAFPGLEEEGRFYLDLAYRSEMPRRSLKLVVTIGPDQREAILPDDPITPDHTPFGAHKVALDRFFTGRANPLREGKDVQIAVYEPTPGTSPLLEFSLDGAAFRDAVAWAGPEFARRIASAECQKFRATL